MDENSNQRLHSVVLTESSESNISKESEVLKDAFTKKKFICCFSNKWCFDHTNPAAYRIYDEDDYLCCTFFDCCSWCLEFQREKSLCCKKNVVCFMCCCSISFQ